MSGYTKLWSSIVHSTVWREEKHVRVLWVTMLALAGKDGRVEASVPGLADASRITLDECVEGLGRLTSPDRWSRNQQFEGRRVAECPGGWVLLNHEYYRDLKSAEQVREAVRLRVRRHRAKKRVGNVVTGGVTEVTQSTLGYPIAAPYPTTAAAPTTATGVRPPAGVLSRAATATGDGTPTTPGEVPHAESVAIARAHVLAESPSTSPAARQTWLTRPGDLWRARWGADSEPPFGEMAKAFERPRREFESRGEMDELWARWERFLAAADTSQFARPARFVQGLGEWAEGGKPRGVSRAGHKSVDERAMDSAREAIQAHRAREGK